MDEDRGAVFRSAPLRAGLATLLLLVFCSSCAFFQGKPALPKRASIESFPQSNAGEDFAGLIKNADIIYFPVEQLASSGASEPAWKLTEALQRSGVPFALAFDVIDAEQQPLLEAGPAAGRSVEALLAQLTIFGSGRDRGNCLALLRKSVPLGIAHLALRCPHEIIMKMRSGTTLTAAEEQRVPHDFNAPAGGLESFAEQFPNLRHLSEGEMSALYRSQAAAREFAAARIIQFVRAREGAKLLVFAHRRDLETIHGVPFFVTQKVKVRQLVLDAEAAARARPNLLTWKNAAGEGGRGEIVDNTPRSSRDQP